jgi:hypothetical protein
MPDQIPSRLTEHDILFLDCLGFAAAAQNWDDQRMSHVIDLLEHVASAQSDFDIEGEPLNDGSFKIKAKAAITTFSDHIVVSYPRVLKRSDFPGDEWAWNVVSDGWNGMVRREMLKISGYVAMSALDVGLLVRGGLSCGKLYHTGHVVVGEAMVDAYRLESAVAQTARIVVSPRVQFDASLFIDTDGQRCLDYFTELMLFAEERHGNAGAWIKDKINAIHVTIGDLKANGQANAAAKWSYFEDKLRYTRDTWPS